MATFKKSQFGGLSGKIGPVVIYERDGKQIVRSNPVQHNPKTPAQEAHRMKFSLSNKGLSPLNKVIKIGYKNSEKNYRKLVGEAYHNAIVGEYPNFTMDYSKIKVAEGNVNMPTNVVVNIDKASNQAIISWDSQIASSSQQCKKNDQVNIVCLNSSLLFAEFSLNAAKRSDGKVFFEIPASWEYKDLNFWVFMSSNDLQENSDSLFVK